MINFEYLRTGVYGLANAHKAGTMAGQALEKNVGETRQSGHNIIFASIAIRALRDHANFATPQVINGVCKLTEGFNTTHAGRGYYGKEKGWLNGNQVELAAEMET